MDKDKTRPRSAVARLLLRVNLVCGLLSGVALLLMMIAGAADVIGTNLDIIGLQSRPIPAAFEFMAESFEKLVDWLPWYQRQEPALPDFMHGHANAFIIGPQGLEERGGVTVGVSFLAPGVEYPNHNHPPQELYVVMSDGDWRQNDDPWHAPGLGGLVYNPANITHSMRSSQQPLLAIWCLWT